MITGVTQDEPVNSDDDGDTAPDAAAGQASNEVQIRSERSGAGDGRVYRISFTAENEAGDACVGMVAVSVPLNKSAPAVDSAPPSFDSFGS